MASLLREPRVVYRIADRRHPLFDPTGAFLHGGRWNSKGRRVIYAAATYAGALLETLAHANIGRIPQTFAYIGITLPQGIVIDEVRPEEIPGWNTNDFLASRKRGDRWHEEKTAAVLIVPSAVTGGIESNVLINADHPDFVKISASEPRQVIWDPRLIRN
jgi:RES domain-containing protein